MNSIDKNQPEDNYEDLHGEQAIRKMQNLVDKAKTCFCCTNIARKTSFDSRPMAVQKVDDAGVFWFLSASDSKKNSEILEDPAVHLFFQGSPHSDFLSLYGDATVSRDKDKIKELWEPLMKAWFTEGENDPRITVIRFVPQDGHYWDTKNGKVVAFAKQVAGAIMGKTLDDSMQGDLTLNV